MRSRVMQVALVALVIVSGCAATRSACPAYTPSAVARPFVWRVAGPAGAGSLVIQATHQGAGSGDISRAAWADLEHARLYITETAEATDRAPHAGDDSRPLFHLPAGTSLRRLLPDGEFEVLREYIGITPRQLARLKPWVAFMLLGRSQVEFDEPSMQETLLERARTRRVGVMFLETWEEQVAYLDLAITPAKLSAAIRDAPDLSCKLGHRLAAFRAGEDAVFANDVAADEPVVARIVRWYVQLRAVVESGQRAVVAVGIGQLLGPHGLLARFAADGYQVERL